MAKGYLCLVLHAHLPFVRHPEHDDPLEERWLYEAITESYLPMLDVFLGFERDSIDWHLTMSLSPTLCAMLSDELLVKRYDAHLSRMQELSEKELLRTRTTPEFHKLAQMYHARLKRARFLFEQEFSRNLLGAFKRYSDIGRLELITCSATHGFLPVLRPQPKAVRAQILVGAQSHAETFGTPAKGMWNAECGFYPGVDIYLKEAGIKFFFVDSHGILFASKRPREGVFAPIVTPTSVAAFGRDIESSRSVWSAQEGYPGDPRYREYYRDIGFDLDAEYLRTYIHESGLRVATGFKYHSITGKVDLREKAAYSETAAREAAAEHASHFVFSRQQQALHLSSLMERPPIIVAPYDAELFGHWWYEGPNFLDAVVRKIHTDQEDIELITPSMYLERHPENQVATPSLSSWGNNGYSEVWVDSANDWIYRHLHKAAERMEALAKKFGEASPTEIRALNQAARELLLAQSSDWAFIMKTNTMVEYATKRTKDHLQRFTVLHDQLMSGYVDEVVLEDFEIRDAIFPNIDYRIYR
jgi:1,4-alpha-glucan branching enzyme